MLIHKRVAFLPCFTVGLLVAVSGFSAERLEVIGRTFDQSVLLAADEVFVADAVFQQDVTIEGDVTIERCLFEGKLFLNSWGTFDVSRSIFEGGVVIGGNVQNGRLVNNTIVGSNGTGVELQSYRSVSLVNNIIAYNRIGVSNHGDGVDIDWNDVYGNREDYFQCPNHGDVSIDPLFRNRDAKDWRLTDRSPCIDAGDQNILDSDSSRSDIGALPFLRDEPLPRFSLLSPENASFTTDTLITFRWEPVRYARLYRLTLDYGYGNGDVYSRGSDTLMTPLSAIEVNLNDLPRGDGDIVVEVRWIVEAITFSDTVSAREWFIFHLPWGEVKDSPLTPYTLHLAPPYPNPFNSSTTISYTLPRPGRYALDVVDVRGRLVTRLSYGWKEAGSYREVWDGRSFASGQYIVILNGNAENEQAEPLLLVK